MFDGSAGVYPRRAPLVGRLGVGELRLNDVGGGSESYFIDGGFIQVKGSQVSVLTNSAQPVSEISRAKAAEELQQAKEERVRSEAEFASQAHKLERARKLVSLAKKN